MLPSQEAAPRTTRHTAATEQSKIRGYDKIFAKFSKIGVFRLTIFILFYSYDNQQGLDCKHIYSKVSILL